MVCRRENLFIVSNISFLFRMAHHKSKSSKDQENRWQQKLPLQKLDMYTLSGTELLVQSSKLKNLSYQREDIGKGWWHMLASSLYVGWQHFYWISCPLWLPIRLGLECTTWISIYQQHTIFPQSPWNLPWALEMQLKPLLKTISQIKINRTDSEWKITLNLVDWF